ncbi:PIG3 family NAD(P)H quinone oxidoreductase-like protein [Tothia fuscella]|uniref:PIG3 family NAD(P)H quinone oxidoreductase-like protein n=1 Tax=Tothia fuscella TaxID=1048955 RepID=A0A9P4U4K0_9PEZI|nr:PIG3 family NAD(P)H quinone oxidoreductase-like protein [Tothia fuscella]
MSQTMRAVDIKNGKGPAGNLFINADTPKPTPTKTQALVKVKYFGLNRMDLLQREGQYPLPPQAPKTLGVEFSGTIESFGNDAEKGFNVGDEVFGLAYGGAYAEYIAVSTHMLIHKPSELSWEECAGIPETWITATQALYLVGAFESGKSVLWHAGASSVSISGQQLSKAGGASAIYATARSDEKCKFCVEELGATAAFNQTGDWAEEVLKATDGKGVDLIIDFIGATTFGSNIKALAKDGVCVCLGMMGGMEVPAGVNIGPLVFKRLRYEGSTLRSRDEDYQGKLRDQLEDHAIPKFKDGTFKVHIETVMDWTDVMKAHELMESNKTKGKIICKIT